ncbi:hypothetical protein [Sphingomonas lenta]|nr:hypothetical protein [Sphingomonas lenta]
MKRLALLALLTPAACAAPPATPAPRVASALPAPVATAGLDRVLGRNAAELTQLFGQPDADYREGVGRKLQFESGLCVLDAYLYPEGRGEPRVTHLDTRQPDGSPIDRASCVAAMTRRGTAR